MYDDLLKREEELKKLKNKKEKREENLKALQDLNERKEVELVTMRVVANKEEELEEKLKNQTLTMLPNELTPIITPLLLTTLLKMHNKYLCKILLVIEFILFVRDYVFCCLKLVNKKKANFEGKRGIIFTRHVKSQEVTKMLNQKVTPQTQELS